MAQKTFFEKRGYYYEDYPSDYYVCHECQRKISSTALPLRVRDGEIKRIKVEGRFKNFHPNCFKIYIAKNPNWYNEQN